MNKLIKLSEEHYIVVDDSEIKEGDKLFNYFNNAIYNIVKSSSDRQTLAISSNIIIDDIKAFPNQYKKITHSNQPLEYTNEDHLHWDKIKKISLSEVEEAINGYNVEKIKKEYNQGNNQDVFTKGIEQGIEIGFKAHQELSKDKLFTVEDMRSLYNYMKDTALNFMSDTFEQQKSFDEYIQPLLPPTEWEVEFDKQGKISLAS